MMLPMLRHNLRVTCRVLRAVCRGCAYRVNIMRGRYSLFRPELYWWRMVLTVRKFCEVAVALMFSSTPLFQAWCVVSRCVGEPLRA